MMNKAIAENPILNTGNGCPNRTLLAAQNSYFNENELTEIKALSVRKTYKKDEVILLQGEPGNSFFVILSGKVKVINQSSDGKEVILAILGNEEIFGEMAIIERSVRCATVIALTNTEAIALHDYNFRNIINSHPEFYEKFLIMLLERLRKANTKIEQLALCKAKGRLAHFLLDWSSEYANSENESFRLPLKHHEIASLLGTTRERITRILKELTEEGYIRFINNRIIILRSEELRKMEK